MPHSPGCRPKNHHGENPPQRISFTTATIVMGSTYPIRVLLMVLQRCSKWNCSPAPTASGACSDFTEKRQAGMRNPNSHVHSANFTSELLKLVRVWGFPSLNTPNPLTPTTLTITLPPSLAEAIAGGGGGVRPALELRPQQPHLLRRGGVGGGELRQPGGGLQLEALQPRQLEPLRLQLARLFPVGGGGGWGGAPCETCACAGDPHMPI